MLNIYEKETAGTLLATLKQRDGGLSGDLLVRVNELVQAVKNEGDAAVRRFTEAFDDIVLDSFLLPESELGRLAEKTPMELQETIARAAENIYAYHSRQKQYSRIDFHESKRGIMGQRVIPLAKVGLYVPGGTAAYPSSVLMNAIPAKVAGVEEIIMITPPQKEEPILPAVAYAAKVAGVKKVYTVGGAQAVAALAYGTESIPKVDKIVGPGNAYVASAKKLVYGVVDIDMIAGPSEILVVADKTANPTYVAADLLSQAEHDAMSAAILITTDRELAGAVLEEVEEQLMRLPRNEIARASIETYGGVILVDSLEEAVALSDEIAPEHLELAVQDPFGLLKSVKNAGSVFLGTYAAEPLGDYYAGPNHVLPTNGTARFASPLSVDDFIKKSSFLYYTKEELEAVAEDVIRFAEAEGLTAHANSIRVRQNKNE
ncbi:MAG: histidinol dehydrogenase [Christensenellaceae bacterium]|jgi:histidinol dehydrogenase